MDWCFHNEVNIPVGKLTVKGVLDIPSKAGAVIVFLHVKGSGWFCSRNQQVAELLHEMKVGTLLLDLLTTEEDKNYRHRFDVDLHAERLAAATIWLKNYPIARDCHIGYFVSGAWVAAALKTAAGLPFVGAVVSSGGRPDLAMIDLPNVKAPTLFIVGSLDSDLLKINRDAFRQLVCEKQLELLEGATPVFECPGENEIISELAGNWFEKYL